MEQFYQNNQPLFQQTKKGRSIVKLLRNFWFVLGIIATILIIAGFIYVIWLFYFDISPEEEEYIDSSAETELSTAESDESECNVVALTLHGDLLTYIPEADYSDEDNLLIDATASEDIWYNIDLIEKDEAIKALILEIDSYGGQPVAGEEIANALKKFNKPSVALIRSAGLSAAYLAATGADTIFVSKNSDVGGIGVTMSYLDYSEKNKKEGAIYNSLSTGKFKDTGDPEKALTIDERMLIERDLNILLNNFVLDIANNRKMSIAKVKNLADGSSMLGEQALNNGLVDKIGDIYSVKDFLKEKIGEEANICWE